MAPFDHPSTPNILLIEPIRAEELQLRALLFKVYGSLKNVVVARNYDSAKEALSRHFDVCIMDVEFGETIALGLLSRLESGALPGPVILLAGARESNHASYSEFDAVADWLFKHELTKALLQRSIRYSLLHFRDKRQIQYLTSRDSLTGLLNRKSLWAALSRAFAHTGVSQAESYVLYIDVDNVKAINGAYGNAAGDLVLTHMAAQIAECVGSSDIVCRFGDDEFVIVLGGTSRIEVENLSALLLQKIRKPIVFSETKLKVTASVGACCISDASGDVSESIFLAGQALAQAKSVGRNTIKIYSPHYESNNGNNALIEQKLKLALDEDELFVVYEPFVDTRTSRVIGAEALVRWQSPELGTVSPATFIPIAEHCGLIRAMGLSVLRKVLKAISGWNKCIDLPPQFKVAINVSVLQLLSRDFIDVALDGLAALNLNPRLLMLEVTESTLLADAPEVSRQLARARKAGLSVAIDDFGTGQSSLARLSKIAVDRIKMDIDFIKDVTNNPRTQALTKSIISLGEALETPVLAEGVETKEQMFCLKKMGCNLAQGWYFAPPNLTAEMFTTHLEENIQSTSRPHTDTPLVH